MRIIGGRLKGRVLKCPATDAIRPTSDRLRETIFNILVHAYDEPFTDARVIDLFAGTGAVGFEALSRGASFALMVDQSAAANALIRANAEALGLSGSAQILRRDARKLGEAPAGGRFGLAFLDPPYGKGFAPPALMALRDGGWLEKNALVIVEESDKAAADLPEGFSLIEERRYGLTRVVFARHLSG
ncbi:16S rRNA (guanine(966)-N(2))-methyltransferase RsmD [Methylocapsa palsarum]|uniref:16S rRNA (Guanine966-N2)-methyltransferase n=1 Tax=Methylocapsa palsarum TaxID=1612308 RepID=A0A1I3XEF2_9HYPH|nr:16S rRNA (guanine(966)-N(2))-methyltransferase RsmD [Methylocapsa palsarum]SFK17451.1 16S rRNA (guanine966-N2)-methyltransferase [Methylocapsa palsarum]